MRGTALRPPCSRRTATWRRHARSACYRWVRCRSNAPPLRPRCGAWYYPFRLPPAPRNVILINKKYNEPLISLSNTPNWLRQMYGKRSMSNTPNWLRQMYGKRSMNNTPNWLRQMYGKRSMSTGNRNYPITKRGCKARNILIIYFKGESCVQQPAWPTPRRCSS